LPPLLPCPLLIRHPAALKQSGKGLGLNVGQVPTSPRQQPQFQGAGGSLSAGSPVVGACLPQPARLCSNNKNNRPSSLPRSTGTFLCLGNCRCPVVGHQGTGFSCRRTVDGQGCATALHHGQYQSRQRTNRDTAPCDSSSALSPRLRPPPSALRSRLPTSYLGLFSFAARLPRLPPSPSPDAG
jgi:hypothetical protein